MKKVGIVDYGTGNIASVAAVVARAGGEARLVTEPAELNKVDALILPGVGHFTRAMHQLRHRDMVPALRELAARGRCPILGICLGMQLLGTSSEEGVGEEGLALLPVYSERIRPSDLRCVKVPHMGWNDITVSHGTPSLLRGIDLEQAVFYFANAYAVQAESGEDATLHCATYEHGGSHLAVVETGMLFGVQFHPEKSRSAGVALFRNFLSL